jgi:hypothetical protein
MGGNYGFTLKLGLLAACYGGATSVDTLIKIYYNDNVLSSPLTDKDDFIQTLRVADSILKDYQSFALLQLCSKSELPVKVRNKILNEFFDMPLPAPQAPVAVTAMRRLARFLGLEEGFRLRVQAYV